MNRLAAQTRFATLARFSAAILLASLGGCAATGGTVPPGGAVHMVFTGAPGLNPGPNGSANPAQVRIYSLKSPDKFLNTDYFQLADKDKAILGGDLLFRQDVSVWPGATQIVDSTVLPGQQAIGIAVSYRNIDRSTWRLMAPLKTPQTFTLGADKIAPTP